MIRAGSFLLGLGLLATSGWAQGGPAPVELAQVQEREVALTRRFVGAVEPVRRSTVGSEVEGLVVAYLVEEGDAVKAGQPLARLRTVLLDLRLQAARATLELRRQELAELENGSRPEEIEQARARVQEAEADLVLRRWKLESARTLFKSNSISEDELKEAEMAARRAEAQLAAERAALRLVEQGPRKEKIAQARARLAAQQAEVARLEDEAARHTIRAPFDGFVVAQDTQVGEWLSKGKAVAEIAALAEVDVTVPVLEDYVQNLRRGQHVRVFVDALKGRAFDATLQAVVPEADPQARTFPVKVRIRNEIEGRRVLLKAGMMARVELPVGGTRKTLVVPKDAIVLDGPMGPMVYTVGPERTAAPVPVRLGVAVDGFIEVHGRLRAGQRVVVKGNERLRPGQKLRLPAGGK